MKTTTLLLATLCILLVGCTTPYEEVTTEKPQVVTTINILADMAQNVAGEHMEVSSILPIGSDPHVYEPVPRDVAQIVDAKVVLYNGLNLEKWMEELIENAGGEHESIAVAQHLEPITDEAGDIDPHLWMDPILAQEYIKKIEEVFISVDPEHADAYKANAQAYITQLQELDVWIQEQVQKIPEENRKLLTTHDAYTYFANRYGLELVGSIWGITTEDEPSAQEIAALVDAIKEKQVPAVFVETTVNPKLMERIAQDAGVDIGQPLYGDSLGGPGSGAETFMDMTKTNVNHIVEALS